MKKNSSEKKKQSAIGMFFKSVGEYIKKKYPFLIILFTGFVAITALNFYKISTTDSVAAFAVDDFEIGQISDRTIIAEKSLPSDEFNPVSVQKGEKILKKGFPVTEEGYAKLQKIATSPVYVDYRAFANSEIYLFMIAVLWYLLLSFLPFGRKIKISEVILQVVFVLIIYACASLGGKLPVFSSDYTICIILPLSLCILLLSILYGQLPSVIFAFISSLVILNATNWALPTFLFSLGSALFSAAIVRKISRRIDMIFASIMISIMNIVFVMLLAVIFNENFDNLKFTFFGVALNGFLSGLLALALLTPLELL